MNLYQIYKKHHDAFFRIYRNEKDNPNYPRLSMLREKIVDIRLEIYKREREYKKAVALEKTIPPLYRQAEALQNQFISIATKLPPSPVTTISAPVRLALRAPKSSPESKPKSKSLGAASFWAIGPLHKQAHRTE